MNDLRPRSTAGGAEAPTTDWLTHAFAGINARNQLNPMFARTGEATDFPFDRIPDSRNHLPETAYQIVHDEAMLDGNARLNLATFVGTWMEPARDEALRRDR